MNATAGIVLLVVFVAMLWFGKPRKGIPRRFMQRGPRNWLHDGLCALLGPGRCIHHRFLVVRPRLHPLRKEEVPTAFATPHTGCHEFAKHHDPDHDGPLLGKNNRRFQLEGTVVHPPAGSGSANKSQSRS